MDRFSNFSPNWFVRKFSVYIPLLVYICHVASTLCPQKKTREIFGITYLGRIKFYKIWRSYSWVYFSKKPCNTLTCDVLFQWRLAEVKQRQLVEWRKLDRSIVVAAISKRRRRLSACSRWTFWGQQNVTLLCSFATWTFHPFGRFDSSRPPWTFRYRMTRKFLQYCKLQTFWQVVKRPES